MKCHYIYYPDVGKVLIPGCMGTVAMGVENCTCRIEKTHAGFERERYNEAVRILREKNKVLEQENAYLNRIIKNLLKHKK